MSVGHVARAIEEAGIPTVTIMVQSFQHVAEAMRLPRTLVTRHPMGRPLGAAGDVERQRTVIEAALSLFEGATTAGALQDLESPFRAGHLSSKAP